ncbi:ACP phosphodiesterase [Erwinia sp. HR93]|uniref:ACP phosphodiesterase n=1 Tax=Erwinia sp. HR93 TaxID=3094840 RepID=UPI002ADEDA18|nr:ACP phosphodiesterase [Erwinia sp. HR93]MEA1063875.1 ACP phosphodiesterase [Erwinia sp. HR93]
MNFLAHLHLARLADSSLLGNLLADFVRGNADEWTPAVAAGIAMHRRVDVLTDALPQVREARQWFRPQTRRVSPITLDVMWDHFLSRHWAELSAELPLEQFIALAKAEITPLPPHAPPEFIALNQHMWSERWLQRYQDMSFIASVLNGMANRRPKLGALRDSWHDLNANYAGLERLFWAFYPQMMDDARNKKL